MSNSTKIMGVSISTGNTKVGSIPSVSMTPVLACHNNAPCRESGCMMRPLMLMRPTMRRAYKRNFDLAVRFPDAYFNMIDTFLNEIKPDMFRWHIAGDILDQDYLENMYKLATVHADVKFLAFTKMHHLDFSHRPKNMSIILSMWTNWGNTTKKMPRAWMQDGTENRVPNNAIVCHGSCETCGMCWNLHNLGRDVVLPKHL